MDSKFVFNTWWVGWNFLYICNICWSFRLAVLYEMTEGYLIQDVELLLLREEINHDAIAQNSYTTEFDAGTNKFNHRKESASTSPSGLHLGHFKAYTEVMYVQNN